LYTAYHDLQDKNFSDALNKITIDDYVVISTGSSVMPGVHMREGSVLHPFSVLTSSTIKYGIYAGNPAKLVGHRNNDLKYDPTWNSKFL
jgi:maltose O-acetyltransferase